MKADLPKENSIVVMLEAQCCRFVYHVWSNNSRECDFVINEIKLLNRIATKFSSKNTILCSIFIVIALLIHLISKEVDCDHMYCVNYFSSSTEDTYVKIRELHRCHFLSQQSGRQSTDVKQPMPFDKFPWLSHLVVLGVLLDSFQSVFKRD